VVGRLRLQAYLLGMRRYEMQWNVLQSIDYGNKNVCCVVTIIYRFPASTQFVHKKAH